MLVLKNLTKTFGDLVAVNNLSLSVNEGEIYALLGPNGAGKTTTMRIAAGTLQPDSGEVYVAGINMSKNAVLAKHKIGYVPESPQLYNKLTGREFLEMIEKIWGMDCSEAIEKYVRALNMSEAINDEIGSYSKGMVRKICLIAALIHEPKVFVLDEPTSGLDPVHAAIVKSILLGEKKRNAAIFISTHMTALAQAICDRVGIISGGELVVEGKIEQLLYAHGCRSLEELFIKVVSMGEPL